MVLFGQILGYTLYCVAIILVVGPGTGTGCSRREDEPRRKGAFRALWPGPSARPDAAIKTLTKEKYVI